MQVPCSLMRPSHCFSAVLPDHCLAHCWLAASYFNEICWGFGTTWTIVSWNWVWIRTVFSFFIFKIDVWPFPKLTPRGKDLKNAATNISQCHDVSYHDIWRSAPHRASILGFHECKWIFFITKCDFLTWFDDHSKTKQSSERTWSEETLKQRKGFSCHQQHILEPGLHLYWHQFYFP